MRTSRNGLGPNPAKMTPAGTRVLRRLRGGGELVAQGAGVFTVDHEFYKTRTVEHLIKAGFVSRPRDLFATAAEGGRITDIGLTALDWCGKGSAI